MPLKNNRPNIKTPHAIPAITPLEQMALNETAGSLALRDSTSKILSHSLSADNLPTWESMINTAVFSEPEPITPPKPAIPPEPVLAEMPPALDAKLYKPRFPISSWFSKPQRDAITAAAAELYEEDQARWLSQCETITRENDETLKEWERYKHSLIASWQENQEIIWEIWEKKRWQFLDAQDRYNTMLPELKRRYAAAEHGAIEEYNSLILTHSDYPFSFARNNQLEYTPDSKTLAIDYSLPLIEVIPTLKEAKFIKSKNEVKRTYITDKQHHDLYDDLLYAIVIRTIHELFETDTIHAVDNIILNGWINSIDKAVGMEVNRCILSISITRSDFSAINLAHIDPKECFKRFKGVGSTKLSELIPVAPILNLNKNDRRFVSSYDVADSIQEGDNLASMHWEDFEHLIRELFEKEYGINGGEVRVTQASRDGGVDAVIFDPDPIRGGKIVVQAKRYNNVVGVAAVRDLYGTVINEGAMKGILITTSNYGADAYNFSKNKPITLMNGANLLHLLSKHGKNGRINLKEAKEQQG